MGGVIHKEPSKVRGAIEACLISRALRFPFNKNGRFAKSITKTIILHYE